MSARILVLGAGFGGLELSAILSESLGDKAQVTIIDKSDAFVLGFSKLDVMFGRATLDAVRLPYAKFAKPGVRLKREMITAIDPASPSRDDRRRRPRVRLSRRRAGRRLRHGGDARARERKRILFGRGRQPPPRNSADIRQGSRARRRVRRAVQMPACAQRMRASAARFSDQAKACAANARSRWCCPCRARCRPRPTRRRP